MQQHVQISLSLYSPQPLPHEPLNYPIFQWYSAISITKDNIDNLHSNHEMGLQLCKHGPVAEQYVIKEVSTCIFP